MQYVIEEVELMMHQLYSCFGLYWLGWLEKSATVLLSILLVPEQVQTSPLISLISSLFLSQYIIL